MRTIFKGCLFVILCCVIHTGCVRKGIRSKRGIEYDLAKHEKLDVFYPKERTLKKEVLIFIHGGNWRTGNKNMYKFLGRRFAQKGIVTVVIDYGLSHKQDYNGMITDVSNSVLWVKNNIGKYGGDSSRIFLSGHSAGGHLAALTALEERFLERSDRTLIKGVILIDAFGLDMNHYMSHPTRKLDSIYYKPFSRNPETWKQGSPINHLKDDKIPFYILTGTKTFPAIIIDTERFVTELKRNNYDYEYETVKNKNHFSILGMFYGRKNRYYGSMIEFMKKH